MKRLGGNGLRTWGLGIVAGVLGLVVLPSMAGAATIGTDGTTVQYRAAGGEANQLAITASGTDLFFSDPGAGAIVDVDGAAGCSASGSTATCPLVGFVDTHVDLRGKDDSVSATGNLAPLTALTVLGGGGDDTLAGGNGADTLLGGAGADFIDGNQGNDTAFGGLGTDTFQWDPGDGSDILEGQENLDTLRFNGSNINEKIGLSANGPRLRLTRDVASIVMDISDVEAVNVQSFGGTDTTTVDDLTGTDVRNVTDDFTTADTVADQLVVNGTPLADDLSVTPVPGGARVNGLGARVTGLTSEPTTDGLVINGLAGDDQLAANPDVAAPIGVHFDGGADTDTAFARGTAGTDVFSVAANGTSAFVAGTGGVGGLDLVTEKLSLTMSGGKDTVSAVGNLAAITAITVDGGAGSDTITGSNGADTLLGGPGNDFIDGNQGNDTAFGGTGPDTFQWDPGDGSDILEGQENFDTLRFNASNINERIELSANGPRLRLTRDVATIVMDIAGVEAVNVVSLGGADTTTVNDLTGTGVRSVTDDLSAFGGGGDGAADDVIVNGTSGHDVFNVAGTAATGVDVTGPAAATHIRGQEPTDRLDVHTLAGADAFNTDALDPGAIQFFID